MNRFAGAVIEPAGLPTFIRRDGAAGRPVGRPGCAGARIPRPGASICGGPRPLRRGLALERLCTARTRAGEEALASWLLKPAPPATIRQRHEAITELRPRLDLREDLELLGVEVRGGIDPAALARWSTGNRVFTGNTVFIVATVLGVLGTAALVCWIVWNTLSLLLAMIIFDALLCPCRISQGSRCAGRSRSSDSRPSLAFRTPASTRARAVPVGVLRQLVKSLETDGLSASAQISRLARLLGILDYQRNQLFMPLAFLWLWTIQLSLRIDAWRARSGPRVGDWLKAVGELEAAVGSASYAAENPSDPFPEIVEGRSVSSLWRSATRCSSRPFASPMMSRWGTQRGC